MKLNTDTIDPIQLTENFQKILEFGDKKIRSIDLQLNKTRIKKQVLFFIMCATQSYTEILFKVIKPPNIYYLAAESLFRTILEQYINIKFNYA